jgi:hypothetical protein
LAVAVQGVTIVREYHGFSANVLVYKQRCDACGYLAPTKSFAVVMLPANTYDIQGFACPCCTNYQPVRIRLELSEEVADFLSSKETSH